MISKGLRSLAAALAWLAAETALANRYNLQEPQSIIAHQIYDLHTLIMWIIVAIFVVVFGVMTYSIVMHRKSVGHKAEQFHENIGVEIVWTIIPVHHPDRHGLARDQDRHRDEGHFQPGHHDQGHRLPVEVGLRLPAGRHQLLQQPFHPARPDRGIGKKGAKKNEHYLLEVDNPVVVPVGKKVRIITTANDVIHSWWVPALGDQAGRHPRLRARHLVQGGQPGHLPRPVRRAVRQGSRLHADRGRSGDARAVRRVGRRAEEENGRCGAGPRQAVDARRAEGPGREGLRRQLRCLPPGRPAWACRARSRRCRAPRS